MYFTAQNMACDELSRNVLLEIAKLNGRYINLRSFNYTSTCYFRAKAGIPVDNVQQIIEDKYFDLKRADFLKYEPFFARLDPFSNGTWTIDGLGYPDILFRHLKYLVNAKIIIRNMPYLRRIRFPYYKNGNFSNNVFEVTGNRLLRRETMESLKSMCNYTPNTKCTIRDSA
ncbi:unnamed protein product [Caenorhabditis bovis]|uniref:Uncharacterized protein n=1 Tax=Caenorhabditis bovis TaxID=2654633 RepID=A0A8S1EGI3_9PELO|nr:unnamed protein product [Caenorhabditis bovis]